MKQDSLNDSAVKAIFSMDMNKLKAIANSIPKDKVSEVLSRCDRNGKTPLNVALNTFDTEYAKFLLEECHVDPMVKNETDSLYPLSRAAFLSQLEVVEMLIEAGAKLNVLGEKRHESPLCLACRARKQNIFSFLIEKGQTIDLPYCLINAIQGSNNKFIKYLLKYGVDVNAKDEEGNTPLHACCEMNNFELLKVLIDKGAIQSSNSHGLKPLHIAAINGSEDIINFFAEKKIYTADEVLDCMELLGVHFVLQENSLEAVKLWNKVLESRSEFEAIPFESSFFKKFQINPRQISNFDHLIGDIENAAIHSMIIQEKIFGFKKGILEQYLGSIAKLIPIMNVEVWEALLGMIINICDDFIIDFTVTNFIMKFKDYVQGLDFMGINSSLLNLMIKLLDGTLKKSDLSRISSSYAFSIYRYYSNVMQCILCLFSIKENDLKFDINCLHNMIKNFLNIGRSKNESFLCILIKDIDIWGFPERIIYETLEVLCKLSETVNELDIKHDTPLHEALMNNSDGIILILLKYGALTDVRNRRGESVREQAKQFERQDICCGSSLLQTLIVNDMNPDTFMNHDVQPEILKYFLKFH